MIFFAAMPGMNLGGMGIPYSAVPMSAAPMSALSYSSMFANVGDPHHIAQAIFRAVSIDVSVNVFWRKCCIFVKYTTYCD